MAAYGAALARRQTGPGLGTSFAARAEGTGNFLAVETCGVCRQTEGGLSGLEERLLVAGQEVGVAIKCPFNMQKVLEGRLMVF